MVKTNIIEGNVKTIAKEIAQQYADYIEHISANDILKNRSKLAGEFRSHNRLPYAEIKSALHNARLRIKQEVSDSTFNMLYSNFLSPSKFEAFLSQQQIYLEYIADGRTVLIGGGGGCLWRSKRWPLRTHSALRNDS